MTNELVLPPSEVTREQILAKLEEAFTAVAQELGLPIDRIRKVACDKSGRLNKASQLRAEQIICLYNQGQSNKEIAVALGLHYNTASGWIHRLCKEGQITPRPKAHEGRMTTIISLAKQRMTLEEVGSTLGVTRERARQLIESVGDAKGKEALVPDKPLWTTSEAAKELGVGYQAVHVLCKQGKVPCKKRGSCGYLLTQEGLEAVRNHSSITGKYALVCVTCGQKFVSESRHPTCSASCEKEYRQTKRAEFLAKELSVDSLTGWQRDLWLRLQYHKLPESEKWLELSEAVIIAGLSRSQVCYLRQRRIITSHEHPTRRWKRRPASLYAASEMEIVRQVYADFQKQGQK